MRPTACWRILRKRRPWRVPCRCWPAKTATLPATAAPLDARIPALSRPWTAEREATWSGLAPWNGDCARSTGTRSICPARAGRSAGEFSVRAPPGPLRVLRLGHDGDAAHSGDSRAPGHGFQSGVYNPITDLWLVRASDAHSWVEAWMPGYGWTTFDPTPPDPGQHGFGGGARRALSGRRRYVLEGMGGELRPPTRGRWRSAWSAARGGWESDGSIRSPVWDRIGDLHLADLVAAFAAPPWRRRACGRGSRGPR